MHNRYCAPSNITAWLYVITWKISAAFKTSNNATNGEQYHFYLRIQYQHINSKCIAESVRNHIIASIHRPTLQTSSVSVRTLQQASTYNMQEVQWRGKLQIPVELVENATLHTKHFGHWTAALTAANQRQRVRHHLHHTMNECTTPSHQLCVDTHLNDTPVNVCHTKKPELKMFYQTQAARRLLKSPPETTEWSCLLQHDIICRQRVPFHHCRGWRECTKRFCPWWP